MAGTLKMLYATNAGRQTNNKKRKKRKKNTKDKRKCWNGNICFVKHAFNVIFLWLYNRTERERERSMQLTW